MSEKRDRITLVCTSHNPDLKKLEKMLESAFGFDAIVLHINKKCVYVIQYDGSAFENKSIDTDFNIPDAYNMLIRDFVKTEWVCCFCDDDFFYPEGLSLMINKIHRGTGAGVAHFKFKISGHVPKEDFRGRIIKFFTGKGSYELCERKPINYQLLRSHNRLPAGSFFRKSAWETVGGFSGDFEHDRILWTKMSKAGVYFKFFDILVYEFVRRENSAWRLQKENQ